MEDSTLSDYNIQESTLYLVLRLRGGLQIFMKSLTDTTITLEVEPSDTIETVKLEDWCTFPDQHIQKESTQNLVLHLQGGMQIFVKTLTGNTFTLKVDPSDIMENGKIFMRTLTSRTINLEVEPIDTIGNVKLEDWFTLPAYNIQKESTLHLLLNLRGAMQISMKTLIFMRTLTSRTINLEVEPIDTIGNVKLEDWFTLPAYNIQKESTLHLLLNLRGAMQISMKTLV
ncbi:polyubiquitin-C-like [Sciurus carolinensis]|uniref:polyubiquitin-C-like n=1 Tax=Sciurus carolinensis TaxID=30640 RepID=UPI001FB47487|nr:polyubiquitin-C-like [Sciurus carolinensis]